MTNPSDWSPCEPGTLNDLQTRLSRTSTPALWTRRGALTAVAGAAAGGIWMVLSADSEQQLTCAQVIRFADAYLGNELDEDTRSRIDAHRRACRPCDDRLAQLEKQQQPA